MNSGASPVGDQPSAPGSLPPTDSSLTSQHLPVIASPLLNFTPFISLLDRQMFPPTPHPPTTSLTRTPTNATAMSTSQRSTSSQHQASGDSSTTPRRGILGLMRKARRSSTSSGSESHSPTSPTHPISPTSPTAQFSPSPAVDLSSPTAPTFAAAQASTQSFHSAQTTPHATPTQVSAATGVGTVGAGNRSSRDSLEPPSSTTSQGASGGFWWASAAQNRQQWHLNEDILLFRHVERNGAVNWEQAVPGRSAEEARIAW